MNEQEGVIQFQLSHQNTDAVKFSQLGALIQCHRYMHQLGLIAQDPSRYDGYAYGNNIMHYNSQLHRLMLIMAHLKWRLPYKTALNNHIRVLLC